MEIIRQEGKIKRVGNSWSLAGHSVKIDPKRGLEMLRKEEDEDKEDLCCGCVMPMATLTILILVLYYLVA